MQGENEAILKEFGHFKSMALKYFKTLFSSVETLTRKLGKAQANILLLRDVKESLEHKNCCAGSKR